MANDKPVTKPRIVIDVTEPGKSTPLTSARPIIVTNRPLLKQDPMMATEDKKAKAEPPTKETSHAVHLQPLEPTSDAAVDAPEKDTPETLESLPTPVITEPLPVKEADGSEPAGKDTDNKAQAVPDADTPPADSIPDTAFGAEPEEGTDDGKDPSPPDAAPTEPAVQETSDEPPKADTVDKATDQQLAPNKALEDVAKKEQDKKAALLAEQEKIALSKKYYLPIDSVERRRGIRRALLVLVLVILLSLVWLDVVLDAGIIKLGGLHPLTHFFIH